jgi:hypothetical protein
LKKKFCRFYEAGQCWYEHSSLESASAGEILHTQETPDPPPLSVSLPSPQTNTEPLLPQTTPALPLPLIDFGTQAVPAPTFNANTQTTPALPLADSGSPTNLPHACVIDAEVQTTSALPMANKMSQTGPQSLIDLLNVEYDVQKGWGYWFQEEYGKKEKVKEIFDERLPQLGELLEWLRAEDKQRPVSNAIFSAPAYSRWSTKLMYHM